ncbi:MAG TPA: OsmC family protein [Gammaproteobacteria bacterium]|nr:OsmC family protein [Gammaproteobacteria bacterium]
MNHPQKPSSDDSVWQKKVASTQKSIDEAIEESFPASDPPAWTTTISHAHPQENLTKTTLAWQRTTTDFIYETYNRDATLTFSGGETLLVSNPSLYYGDSRFTNSEELFVAALSFCYMHTLLAIASKQRYKIKSYTDKAIGKIGNNAQGAMCVVEIQLHPEILFEEQPDNNQIQKLQESAHKHCFIANSISSKINIHITALTA